MKLPPDECHWTLLMNIALGNILVQPGNKLYSEPMLTQIYAGLLSIDP